MALPASSRVASFARRLRDHAVLLDESPQQCWTNHARKADGTRPRPFSQEILEAADKAANEVYAETAAANPRFKKIYENLVAFRSDSYLYWQVAAMSFDLFQARMRTRA